LSADDHTPPANKLPSSPDDVRGVLRELRDDPLANEREFTAQLHRRLVAAGAPPSASWLGRLADAARELWHDLRGDRAQKRSLVTGALVGALVTAVVFSWLSASRPTREAVREAASDEQTVGVAEPPRPVLRPDRKSHTAGDRRLTRDRMGVDIGAERPERARPRPR
jgi:hypothetical protein